MVWRSACVVVSARQSAGRSCDRSQIAASSVAEEPPCARAWRAHAPPRDGPVRSKPFPSRARACAPPAGSRAPPQHIAGARARPRKLLAPAAVANGDRAPHARPRGCRRAQRWPRSPPARAPARRDPRAARRAVQPSAIDRTRRRSSSAFASRRSGRHGRCCCIAPTCADRSGRRSAGPREARFQPAPSLRRSPCWPSVAPDCAHIARS